MTRRLPAGIRPQESCVLEELTHGEELVYFYHDDEEKDDIPNSARDIENGFEAPNAFYVGNDRVAAAEIEHFRLCYETVQDGVCKKKCQAKMMTNKSSSLVEKENGLTKRHERVEYVTKKKSRERLWNRYIPSRSRPASIWSRRSASIKPRKDRSKFEIET